MLCSVCQSVFSQPYEYGERGKDGFRHHENFAQLLRSVALGCHLCTLLRHAVFREYRRGQPLCGAESDDPEHGFRPLRFEVFNDDYFDPFDPHVGFFFEPERPLDGYLLNVQMIPATRLKPALNKALIGGTFSHFLKRLRSYLPGLTQQIGKSVIRESTGSDGAFEQARAWLDDCCENHLLCGEIDGDSKDSDGEEEEEEDKEEQLRAAKNLPRRRWLPTRLVYVGSKDGSTQPRLCEALDIPKDSRYMTLSHCWGTGPTFKLTTANLSHMMERLPVAELPKTFRDAIALTKRLGTDYLWTDSLCIIQDDKDDWISESAHMGDTGLYVTRTVEQLLPCKVYAKWDGKRHDGKEAVHGKYFLVEQDRYWYNAVDDSPLQRRGWAVQERLLAPRILHFSGQQVLWECCSTMACEVFPDGLAPSLDVVHLKSFKFSPKRPLPAMSLGSTIIDSVSDEDPFPDSLKQYYETRDERRWFLRTFLSKLVQIYTQGSLTFSADKLVALSGLAKEVRVFMNDGYFARVWRRDMINQLNWSVDFAATRTLRPPEYRAPSWSWASVDGPVENAYQSESSILTELSEVLDVHVTPTTQDETGAVAAGYVRIRGPLKKAFIRISEFPKWIGTDHLGARHMVVGNRRVNMLLLPDVRWAPILGQRTETDVSKLDPEIHTRWQELEEESRAAGDELSLSALGESKIPVEKIENSEKALYCLPLVKIDGRSGGPEIAGLLLEPTGGAKGEYRRFGKFSSYPPLDLTMWQGLGHGVEEAHYLAYDGERDYTITIV